MDNAENSLELVTVLSLNKSSFLFTILSQSAELAKTVSQAQT